MSGASDTVFQVDLEHPWLGLDAFSFLFAMQLTV
jgi:hypothetical protein